MRFLLLPTNLAREWLQIDTDLLRMITSTTADEHSGGTNIDDLERPWIPKIWVLSDFFAILVCDAYVETCEFSLKYTGYRPAYEFKLMLSRVSWALAQISCTFMHGMICLTKRPFVYSLHRPVPRMEKFPKNSTLAPDRGRGEDYDLPRPQWVPGQNPGRRRIFMHSSSKVACM